MANTYEALRKKLTAYSDKRLVELLIAEKHNPGWTYTRAVYLMTLKQVAKAKRIKV